MPNLDGTEQLKPAPFDAHEQIVRDHHEEAPLEPNSVHSGLQPASKEYKPEDHGGEPVVE